MSLIKPKIVGFLCNWCAYDGADSAGRARKAYAPNLNIIRTMCSGRVDPQFVLEAFRQGADGVMIMGCHPGECHYKEGNFQALKRYTLLRQILSEFGIHEDRLHLEWISAGEGDRFVQSVDEMVERIKRLETGHP